MNTNTNTKTQHKHKHKHKDTPERERDSGHIVKIRTRGAVNFSQLVLNEHKQKHINKHIHKYTATNKQTQTNTNRWFNSSHKQILHIDF